MQVFDKKRRSRLVDEVKKQFGEKGWRVESFQIRSFDLRVIKGSAQVLIECIDGSSLKYMTADRVFAHVQEQSTVASSLACPVLVVLDEDFRSHELGILISRDIPVALITDIARVTMIDRLLVELPDAETTALEILLATRSPTLSLALSNAFKAVGDPEQAIYWARNALRAGPKTIAGYLVLGQLLKEGGDVSGAESTTRDGLHLFPESLPLLATMMGLAVQRGDRTEAGRWGKEIDKLKNTHTGDIGFLLTGRSDAQSAGTTLSKCNAVSSSSSFFRTLFRNKNS